MLKEEFFKKITNVTNYLDCYYIISERYIDRIDFVDHLKFAVIHNKIDMVYYEFIDLAVEKEMMSKELNDYKILLILSLIINGLLSLLIIAFIAV